MLNRIKQVSRRSKVLAGISLVALVGALVLALVQPAPAYAHCDSIQGPVVTAAKDALATGNVNLVLPYVKPESEAELTAAFQKAIEVRRLGGEAQELADYFFFEAAVRLHRQGEGASYTGLKTETDFGPALVAADKALQTGKLEGVYKVLDQAVRDGVSARYQAILEARQAEAKLGTVEAARERVEAELGFELYVQGIYEAVTGAAGHGGDAPAQPQAAHSHE